MQCTNTVRCVDTYGMNNSQASMDRELKFRLLVFLLLAELRLSVGKPQCWRYNVAIPDCNCIDADYAESLMLS